MRHFDPVPADFRSALALAPRRCERTLVLAKRRPTGPADCRGRHGTSAEDHSWSSRCEGTAMAGICPMWRVAGRSTSNADGKCAGLHTCFVRCRTGFRIQWIHPCAAGLESWFGPGSLNLTAEDAILDLLERRGPEKTICPSDAARLLSSGDEDWRERMDDDHQAVDMLLVAGRITLSWLGKSVDRRRGPYRVRQSTESSSTQIS